MEKTNKHKINKKRMPQRIIVRKIKARKTNLNPKEEKKRRMKIKEEFWALVVFIDFPISLYLAFKIGGGMLESLMIFGVISLFLAIPVYAVCALIITIVGSIVGIDFEIESPPKQERQNAYFEDQPGNINITVNKEKLSGGLLTGIAAGIAVSSLINKSKRNKNMEDIDPFDREDHEYHYGQDTRNMSREEIEHDLDEIRSQEENQD